MAYIQVLVGYDPWLYPFVLHDSGLHYLATATCRLEASIHIHKSQAFLFPTAVMFTVHGAALYGALAVLESFS